ncbi:amino acid permease [Natronobacterium gregoryi]|uniref:Amino acid permease n=2 Tax=Natronobacterium gregoryi TaxID=44930 RepID=L0AE79_NATGS|nr:amino acid permease [Natronobacterium gregoryi]AFZ71457.1 amino acid transporter [Natronobacterium gregoryi SP2]ELY66759.1 amino acid permease-associated region [Natronobacterium gregoryi SP2]PLK19949.1 amino acid permease [Natronobacterium gregoryi SP2]SFJ36240.1 amino acid/polyamine/organocation transporter, APC superfamily [Natronobacterium gregoryi]
MTETDAELARDLGFLEAYTLGLGTMIGAGIFVLPGLVAEAAGPASMISFVIGGVVALLAALSLSELATGMPRAGGSYYYVNHALGSFFGTVVGWGMWAGLMFATAFYMLGFGQYLLDQPFDALPVVLAALAMASLLVAVNYRGVKETGSLQNVIVIALVCLILVFIAVGIVNLDPVLLDPFAPEGWNAVGATAGTVFVAFIGFEVIATSAEEIKNPGRNLPLAMIAAVVTPTTLYVLVMLVSTGILPTDALASSDVPVADVAATAAGVLGPEFATVGSLLMIAGATLATISSANASILSAARVNFAMGRDQILTNWLNQIHERYRTPYRAILATGVVILALIASPLPIETLADVASFMFLITYGLVHVAVVVLRRADPDEYDPDFRIPSGLYPIVPALGLFTCLAVMYQMSPTVQGIGLLIVLVGSAWYAFYSKEKAVSTTLIGEAVAPEEPDREEDAYRVVVPVSNPETERLLIKYAAASAASHEHAELVAVNVLEVPPQTSPAQIELEEERVERQQALLENARDVAEDFDVPLRTRALVGRSAGDTLLSVLEEEDADHVLLGWAGERRRRDVLFGSTIDPVLERAPCDVTLAKDPTESPGEIVTLAGSGPNAPVSARRARELDRVCPESTLTLLNVQAAADGDDAGIDPRAVGEQAIESVASEAGLADDEYESRVVVTEEDVRETVVSEAAAYDTVYVGATGTSPVAQALYGTIPESIVDETERAVLMARGEQRSPRTFRQALVQRLEG